MFLVARDHDSPLSSGGVILDELLKPQLNNYYVIKGDSSLIGTSISLLAVIVISKFFLKVASSLNMTAVVF